MTNQEVSNDSAKVVSFINMKGGVGKTTLTVNIADKLVEKGYRVLVIDMDPQFNSTQSLLLHKVMMEKEEEVEQRSALVVEEPDKNELSEEDLSLIEKEIEDEETSTNIYDSLVAENRTVLQLFGTTSIVEKPNLILNIKNNFDLVPGDLSLSQEITGDTSNKDEVIMNFLETGNLKNGYHYILIDCPPTWSILTHSSLFASDFYVIPSKVDLYSSIGIKLLEQQIKKKLTDTTTYKRMGLDLKNLGILFTLIHRTVKAEQTRIDKIKKEFTDIEFFNSSLPHMPSVPTRFTVYSDANKNERYRQLINSIDKITEELIYKTNL